MVVEYIRYTIDADRAETFEQAYRRAAESLDASEHCERYEIARCTDDPTQHVVRIEWDSEEGHLSGFRQSSRVPQLLRGGRPVRERHRGDASLPGDAFEHPVTPTLL